MPNRKNTMADFWRQVQVGKPDECWPWTGRKDEDGYGKFQIDGRVVFTHRLAFEVDRGVRLTSEVLVMHRCDNPPCCNPRCLTTGTQQDNQADKISKGRTAKREGHGRARMTWAMVRQLRSDRAAGMSIIDLAAKYQISNQQVSNIHLGRHWQEDNQAA